MRKWLYKKNEAPKIFKDGEIEQAKAKGWSDSPADLDKVLISLKEEATRLNITFASNIGEETLRAKILEFKANIPQGSSDV